MRSWRFLVCALCLVAGASACAGASATTQIVGRDRKTAIRLPVAAARAVRTYDPMFVLWRPSDFAPEVWRGYKVTPRAAPFALIEDLNGDGILDPVLSGHGKAYSAVLAVVSSGQGWRVHELWKGAFIPEAVGHLSTYLRKIAPGTVTIHEGEESSTYRSKLPGVEIVFGESVAIGYFFERKGFKEVVTAD